MSEIEYEVREKDLIAFNEHLLQNSEKLQKVMRRHQSVLPGIIVMIAMILFFYFQDTLSAIYVSVTALAWGCGVPVYLKWSMRRQIKNMYTEEEKLCSIGKYKLKADKEALVEVSAQGETKMSWSDVLRVEITKKYAFVFVSIDSALIVPRDTLTKGSNLHEFVKLADEYIG